MPFTNEELAAMREADEELENKPLRPSLEDIRTSKRLELEAKLAARTPEQLAANKRARAKYHRNREARAAQAREYYWAHREERAAYYQAHRAEKLEYQKAYNDAKKAGR